MRVTPFAIIRALLTRLSIEERAALAAELLEGAVAAPRPNLTNPLQPVKS